jgi:hypothetical protein
MVSKTCYVAAFITTLALSSYATVLALEIAFLLPMLVMCAATLEYLSVQEDRSRIGRVLRVEMVLITLLFVSCIFRFWWAWPLHAMNIGAIYHNVVSEWAFYTLLNVASLDVDCELQLTDQEYLY